MSNKVFLEHLPRRFSGIGQGGINWKETIGCDIRFVYDNTEGFIKIVDYDTKNQMLIIEYNSAVFYISTGSLQKCKLGHILGKITKDFKVKIGTQFKDSKRDLIIIDREYRTLEYKPDKKGRTYCTEQKWYKYMCNKCGWKEGWILEINLLKKNVGCSCCNGKSVVSGINDIATTCQLLIMLGVDKEEAKKFTKNSGKKIKCTCPHCGEVKYKTPNKIYSNRSIGCSRCGDGFSYPEKFIHSMLKQLGIEFQTQLNKTMMKWCDKYKYDFYIPSLNCIIETHGKQHYEEGFSRCGGFVLNEVKNNDSIKKNLALSNGVDCYIVLDCRESDLEWVRNSVLCSELKNILDLSKIDWLKCEEYAINSNKVKEVCDYWNNKGEWETTRHLVKTFNLSAGTVIKYLNQGKNLGWCNYDVETEKIKGSKSGSLECIKINSKEVGVFKDSILLGIFKSASDLCRVSEDRFGVKLTISGISQSCNGKLPHYKGFTFKYVDQKEGDLNG